MVNITPVNGALGAIVKDVKLVGADEQVLAQIKTLLDKYLVLYLPRQCLDRFQLSQLATFFGKPFLHPIVNNGFEDCPQVLELVKEVGHEKMFGGESWHSDVSWQNPSAYVSILHSKEIPQMGGDTAFASTQCAFDALSSGYKSILRKLKAIHSYYWYERREGTEHTVEHPVIRRHPVTDKEGLFINRMFTSRFVGMSHEESKPLLDYLFDHMEQHQFTCRFQWDVNAVIIWDNRFTLHYPINDFSGQRRTMIRTTALEY